MLNLECSTKLRRDRNGVRFIETRICTVDRHYGVGAYAEGMWYQIHGDNDVGIDHNGSARFLRKDYICVTCRNSSFFVPMHVVLCNWNAVHF